jgi:myo-inositol 2-dehydrogenase/D-chiro-inositol 1-dehydrogenase
VIEHAELIRAIREGKPINDARQVAESTLSAIMGRIAAYSGQIVRWADLTETKTSPWYDLRLSPAADDFEKGPVKAPKDDVVAMPGEA